MLCPTRNPSIPEEWAVLAACQSNSFPLFGLLIPGLPVLTEFQWVDPTHAVMVLNNPAAIPELSFFFLPTPLLPNLPDYTGAIGTFLPPDYGVVLYYSLPTGVPNWEPLGALHPMKPSGLFRTAWPLRDDVKASSQVQLGVAIEPMSTIANLKLVGSGVEERLAVAEGVARDLFNYMCSFAPADNNVNAPLVVPRTIFDQWLDRFRRKFTADPQFFMRSSS